MKRILITAGIMFVCCCIFLIFYKSRESGVVPIHGSVKTKPVEGTEPSMIFGEAFALRVKALSDDSKVKAIMSEDRLPVANQKIEALSRAGRFLDKEECFLLQAYILGAPPAQIGTEYWHWVINDTLVTLCKQTNAVPYIADTFCRLYYSDKYDDVIRAYAIQHMATLYLPMESNSQFIENASERNRLLEAISDAACKPDKVTCGVALNSLNAILRAQDYYRGRVESRLPESDYILSEEKVIELASAVLEADVGDDKKVTALAILSQQGVPESLIYSRTALEKARGDMMLKMVALRCLGQMGDESDRERLEFYAQSRVDLIRNCAAKALESLGKQQF